MNLRAAIRCRRRSSTSTRRKFYGGTDPPSTFGTRVMKSRHRQIAPRPLQASSRGIRSSTPRIRVHRPHCMGSTRLPRHRTASQRRAFQAAPARTRAVVSWRPPAEELPEVLHAADLRDGLRRRQHPRRGRAEPCRCTPCAQARRTLVSTVSAGRDGCTRPWTIFRRSRCRDPPEMTGARSHAGVSSQAHPASMDRNRMRGWTTETRTKERYTSHRIKLRPTRWRCVVGTTKTRGDSKLFRQARGMGHREPAWRDDRSTL